MSANPTKALSPAQYFSTIQVHSKTSQHDTLYAGDNFRALVRFLSASTLLKQPSASHNASQSAVASDGRHFALIYILKDLEKSPKSTPLCRPLPDLLHSTGDANTDGVLMFLTGYPSPDWILQLGATYHIDPEFFRLHLDFDQNERERSLEKPCLPSYRKSMFQLHTTTIGYHTPPIQLDLRQRRARSEEEMAGYLRSMKNSVGWKEGDSIVRAYAIHDAAAYSVEQSITICLCKPRKPKSGGRGGNWMCLIWLDSGRELSLSPSGPWRSHQSRDNGYFLPIRLYKPGVSLKDHVVPYTSSPGAGSATEKQSASLLPFVYGRSLNPAAMCLDPFYALNEVFTFVVQSENQFLNLIQRNINENTVGGAKYEVKSLLSMQEELSYIRSILGRHIEHIQNTTDLIKSRADLDWPKYREGQASTATRWLERDYDHTLRRAIHLQERCERETDMLMNRASLEESKASANQASRVTRLTILASFFIPLSFSTSIFGMNFVTFSKFTDGLWVWIIVSVPLFIVSFSVISWNKDRIQQLIRTMTKKWEKPTSKSLL